MRGHARELEQLKLYYDYTKWHVGLYAGSIVGAWLLRSTTPFEWSWWCQLLATLLLLTAAGCAGAICATIPERQSLAELDSRPITFFQIAEREKSWWPKGKSYRRAEKICFWLGVVALVVFFFGAPKDPEKPAVTVNCKCQPANGPACDGGPDAGL